jgi:hypothetical protein
MEVQERDRWWYDRVRGVIRDVNEGYIDTIELVAIAFANLRYGMEVFGYSDEKFLQVRAQVLKDAEPLEPQAKTLLAPYLSN